jgi:hypothetical protein
VINDLTKKCKVQLKESLDVYKPHSRWIYALKLKQDPIVIKTEHDGQEYDVTFTFSNSFGNQDSEKDQFLSIMYKQLLRANKFEQIGRNCYNTAKRITIQNFEIWPGLFSSVKKCDSGTFIQLELSYKCIREDTLLETLEKGRN